MCEGELCRELIKRRLIQKISYAFKLPVFKISRCWAISSSNKACYPPFPHQQPTLAMLPTCPTRLPPFLPARSLSFRQVSSQVLLRICSRSAFLKGNSGKKSQDKQISRKMGMPCGEEKMWNSWTDTFLLKILKGTLKSLDGALQRVTGYKSHRKCVLSVDLQDETPETHPAREKASCAPMGEEGRWRSQKADNHRLMGNSPWTETN